MSILDQKKKVFGNIAALRTLTDGFPKLKLSSSFPSINNGGNPISFLTDLIKSLIGYEALVGTLNDILVYNLKEIEHDIKLVLKKELKTIVSCGVNPSIPSFLTSTGIIVPIDKIDFTDLFLVDPNTPSGKLLYNDLTLNLIDSSDMNTFLYQTIQNNGTTEHWGNTTIGTDILDLKFESVDITNTNPNNSLTIKVNPTFASTHNTLTELNNNFIDSISLFQSENIITNILDSIFGSISFSLQMSRKQLEKQAAVNNVIDCIINSDEDDVIDDSYFTFTNEELYVHEQSANMRKNGITKLQCCNKIIASVPVDLITQMNDDLAVVSSLEERKTIISNHLDTMATYTTKNAADPSDHMAIKLNFMQEFINNLSRVIVNTVISPKVVLIFMINHRIVYGSGNQPVDGVDFIKQNKALFKSIIKKIIAAIIKVLIAVVLKEIAVIVGQAALKTQIEKGKSDLAQLLTLTGVPQSVLRILKGLL